MYPLAYNDRDNIQVVTQICINLPLSNKNKGNMIATVWENEIPVVEGEGWKAYVITGTFRGVRGIAPNPLSWASDPSHHILILRIAMEAGSEIEIGPTDAATRNVYLTEGGASVGGTDVHRLSRVKLSTGESAKIVMGDTASDVWLLEGDPIGEKQRSYGPVMLGSDREVRDALNVVRQRQETDWPWDLVNKKQPLGTERFFMTSDGAVSRPPGPAPGEHRLPPKVSEEDAGGGAKTV